MKLSDFTIWEGLFGIDGEFYLSHSTSNFYDSVVSPLGYDDILRKRWEGHTENRIPFITVTSEDIIGDSKNNFAFISPGLFSGDIFYDEDKKCYLQSENVHIIESIFFNGNPTEEESLDGVYAPHFPNYILKPKDELKKYFSKILGKDLFNLIESDKIKLILDSHSELISREFSEALLFVLDYVGLKNPCVLVYNSQKFKNPKVISWDYFLYDFEYDLQPLFEMGGYFPLSDSNIKYLSEYKKPKRYVSYNANLHGHRLFNVLELYNNKLDKYGLISVLNRSNDTMERLSEEMINFLSYLPEYSIRNISDYENSVVELLKEYYQKFPIILDIDVDFLQLGDGGTLSTKFRESYGEDKIDHNLSIKLGSIRTDRYIHIEHLIDTYFSVISETSINNMHSNWDNEELVHICEKTYKGLASPHPFILYANDGVLKYLRSIGFQTFPEMFDESYDEEKDTHKRFNLVFNQIKILCKMDTEEVHKKFVSVLPKIKHNHELLLSFDRKELLLNKLMDISNA